MLGFSSLEVFPGYACLSSVLFLIYVGFLEYCKSDYNLEHNLIYVSLLKYCKSEYNLGHNQLDKSG